MSDDEGPKYKDGDVVWVKLGSCWWPGEVTENAPEDYTSKKPPLAIVKFFNETTYEFVKTHNNIYYYNCDRKNEFIRKGMDSFRANNTHMAKFPGDVSLAELRTDGNPNILSDPIFAPQKQNRSNIIAEVFGSPSPKKTPKENKHPRRVTSKNSAKKPKVNITHRRFLGCDDYEAHIRVQYPGKDTEHLSSDEEIVRLNAEPTQTFNCSTCSFNTNRLEVMLFHVQCHIKGIASPVQVKKKASPKKKKARVIQKHVTSDDDRTNSSAGYLDTDSEEEKPRPKKKKRAAPSPKKPKPKKVEEEKTVTDIRTNLLAEWSDSEDNEEVETSRLDTSGELNETNEGKEEQEEEKDKEKEANKEKEKDEKKEANKEKEKEPSKTEEPTNKDSSKSCFDFDEEDEDSSIVHTAVGRKIPRVIPPTDKRKSTDPDNEDASLPVAEDDQNRIEILKVSENLNESSNSVSNDVELGKEEEVFKDLMDSTSVPELPEVPDSSKPQKNFLDTATVKIPDKKSESVTEVATKLTNPKKRFVKSFEDFELLQNEQRRAQEEREEEMKREKAVVETIETMEPVQAMEITSVEELSPEAEQLSTVVEIPPPVVEEPSPFVEESSPVVEEPSPVVEEPTPVVEEASPIVEEASPIVEEASPIVEEASPIVEESSPTIEPPVVEPPVEETPPLESLEEHMQVETPIIEETPLLPIEEKVAEKTEEEAVIEDAVESLVAENPERSELKAPDVTDSKEFAEPKEPIDVKVIDSNVQISKLKCQIMSKLSDEEPETSRMAKGKSSHRTPRSKILESYRNDKSKEKQRKSVEEKEEFVEELKKEHHAPKKSKYLKFNREGNESVEKIEEEPVNEETKSDIIKEVEAIPEKNPDEEIGKINQIDEYLNDFLFDFPKKTETPTQPLKEIEEKQEEAKIAEKVAEETVEETPSNELHIKCASINDEQESEIDISIKTNLTNFNKSEEEMSALSTLAMVSQLETNVEKAPEEEKVEEQVKLPFEQKSESELVPIDGNLTVVSEKDLADGQVEITASTSPIYKKPVTLSNFSMDFSECNSNSTNDSVASEEEKPKEEVKKIPGPEEVFDLEEHIPSQIVDKSKPSKDLGVAPSPHSSKLLERLTERKFKDNSTPKSVKVPTKDSTKVAKTKFIIRPSAGHRVAKPATPQSNKPIILSEKIIKPIKGAGDSSGSVSVQKITSKRNLHDPDEIDAFIIQKGAKNVEEEEDEHEDLAEIPAKKSRKNTSGMDPKKLQVSSTATSVKKRGKAKILQQTIITPAGEIIQPTVSTKTTAAAAVVAQDDNVFDINSMPIVLSDQILTPESIENMPIYLSDTTVQSTPEPVTPTTKIQTTIVKKTPVSVQNQGQMRLLNKSIASPVPKLVKTPKILGSMGSKLVKHNSFSSGAGKHGKYVIVTQASGSTPTSKYTVGKKQAIIKRVAGDLGVTSAGTLTKVQNIAPEPSGNKIMILTDQQGQQQRVLLTPAQQKMMGYQGQGGKVAKTLVKGNILHKSKDGQMTAVPGSSGLISKSITPSRLGSQTLISSSGHVLTPIHPQQAKTMRIDKSAPGRKIQMQSQKVPLKPPQKTILIKNQHGQTVRKIQGTDDALLDKQVAEQIEAIKASGALHQKQEILNYKSAPKTAFRRSYAKKESPKPAPMQLQKPKEAAPPPPLAPISPKKEEKAQEGKQERALHQLVIQDAMGNQTTITEGQILALPSETIDGQPQSYMLVTLDESGNLTPLNNEALLSLDPNLGLGGDLGNTVLQIDQSALKEETTQAQPEAVEVPKTEPAAPEPQPEVVQKEEEKQVEVSQEQIVDSAGVMQTMGETGQQLIVTGDPIAAQKFLESLTEGNTDLANILASAEGSSILIHADGQQILINTDSDNQMLLSVNTDNLNMAESTEGGGNPIFATQPTKNQDILAAALADTDVFQQEQNGQKVSQLSPNSALYPMNVGNVLETSLTLNSPIMTPLEVPSTNTKKISDENDILNQIPKNVDLPITITDPNISQTVSQQQVASMMVNELQSNLELSLPISDAAITVTSSEMNSPNFVYSLPSLDGADINQKPFNSSMPLLTEDTDEVSNESKENKPEPVKSDEDKIDVEEDKNDTKIELSEAKISPDGSFLDESEGLCTLGGEMCSSLSEPPPDMFDLSAVLSSHQMKTGAASPKDENKGGELEIMEENDVKIDDKGGDESVSSESVNPDTASVTETSSPNTMNEDSCEIPVQPEIVTTLKEDGLTTGCKRGSEDEVEVNNKKCKFD